MRHARTVLAVASATLLATTVAACGGEDDTQGATSAAEAFMNATSTHDAEGVCGRLAVAGQPLKDDETLLGTCTDGMELTFKSMTDEDTAALKKALVKEPDVKVEDDSATVSWTKRYTVKLSKIDDSWYVSETAT